MVASGKGEAEVEAGGGETGSRTARLESGSRLLPGADGEQGSDTHCPQEGSIPEFYRRCRYATPAFDFRQHTALGRRSG